MTQQPEALRLADAMEGNDAEYPDDLEVADELRRLHSVNALLLEALEECVEDSQSAVDQYVLAYGENFRPHRLKGLREIVAKARAAIAAAKDSNAA